MKTTFFILILAAAAVSCCKNDDHDDLDQGTIIGIDYRECVSPYCGGWFIEIGSDTLRFFEVPDKTDINFNSILDFPIPVRVSWHKYTGEWAEVEDLIKVEEIWKD